MAKNLLERIEKSAKAVSNGFESTRIARVDGVLYERGYEMLIEDDFGVKAEDHQYILAERTDFIGGELAVDMVEGDYGFFKVLGIKGWVAVANEKREAYLEAIPAV